MPVILVQTDLKKLLAFSTIVNVSFLYVLLVVSNAKFVCIYFIVHGFFKSLSFLLLGVFVLINKHSQDMRSYVSTFSMYSFVGFLFFLCIFFLSGFNFIYIYKIKHLFDFNHIPVSYVSFLFDFIFIFYSVLSALYALKIFYYIHIKKTKNTVCRSLHHHSLLNYANAYYLNTVLCLYFFLSLVVSYVLYIFIGSDFYGSSILGFGANNNLIGLSIHSFLYLVLPLYVSVFNKTKNMVANYILLILFIFLSIYLCLIKKTFFQIYIT